MLSSMTKRFSRRWTLLSAWSLCVMLAFVMSLAPGATAEPMAAPSFRVVDPGQKTFGKTYGQWASDWWDWVLQFPASGNPLLDETGELCDLGDQGQMWFLAGNFGGTTVRECTAPAGKTFFFPVFNVISFAPEFGSNIDEVRADANHCIEHPDPTDALADAIISCEIDGDFVDDVYSYRAQSSPGGYVLNNTDLLVDFGLDPGPRFPAVSDGYWIMLRGLGPGEHVIRIRATAAGAGFDLDVTYNLTLGHGMHHNNRPR